MHPWICRGCVVGVWGVCLHTFDQLGRVDSSEAQHFCRSNSDKLLTSGPVSWKNKIKKIPEYLQNSVQNCDGGFWAKLCCGIQIMWPNLVSTMSADALVPCSTRSSAVMIFTTCKIWHIYVCLKWISPQWIDENSLWNRTIDHFFNGIVKLNQGWLGFLHYK